MTKSILTLSLALSSSGFAASIINNSGFEASPLNPAVATFAIPGGNVAQYNDTDIPSWNTTAADGLLELWDNGANGINTYDGSNTFAEVNATEAATLYQESTFGAGVTVDYLFAHRGRQGEDVLRFTITDLGANGTYEAGAGDDTVMVNILATSGTSDWNLFYGNDIFVSSANAYRFQYEAVSSTGGDDSFGNFIDAFASGSEVSDVISSGVIGHGSVASAAAVPEPSSSALLVLSSSLLMLRRKRQ